MKSALLIISFLALAGIAVYGVINRDNIRWPRNIWAKYKDIEHNFSFKYPPNLLIKELNASESPVKGATLSLSLTSSKGLFGYVYIIPVSFSSRSVFYKETSSLTSNLKPVIVYGTHVNKEVNFSSDLSSVASFVSEVPFPYNSSIKVRYVVLFNPTDSEEVRKLKESYFSEIIETTTFQQN